LRISEALALTETDLDPKTGSVLVRAGNGGKRRTAGMDDWAWEHVARWTEHRIQLPIGPLFCILAGPTRGRRWSATAARGELRQLGHAHLGITSIYLQESTPARSSRRSTTADRR
jgi:integrase